MEKVLYRMRAPSLELVGISISDLMYSEYLPFFSKSVHRHDTWQIMYVLNGQGVVWLNDVKVDFKDGYIIVIRPNDPHGYATSNSEVTKTFEIKCHLVDQLTCCYTSIHCSSVFRDEYGFRPLVTQAIDELRFKPENWDLMLRAYLLELFVRIGRALASELQRIGDITFPAQTYAYRYTVVAKAAQFYREHIKEEISARDAAEHLFLNPRYFCSIVKTETGQTASELLIDIRIRRACELLQNTVLTIHEIGEAIGYSNIYYFSRLFKKRTGLAPTIWRDRNKTER